MMRWVVFSISVVAIAAVATVTATFLSVPSSPDKIVPTAQDKPAGPPGSVSIEGSLVHNFGAMAQYTPGRHEWTLTNKGPGEVKLSMGQPSCSCTIADLKGGKTATLAAGETIKVTLNWNTKHFHDKYRQTAPLLVSNDPENHSFEFAVEGDVQPAVSTYPPDASVTYLTVSADTPSDREVAFYSKDRPDLKITAPIDSMSTLFNTKIEPLSAEECKHLKVDKGQKLVVTLKPSAPLGRFSEDIVVATDHPARPEVKVRATGKVVGPITLTPERVEMTDVPAKAGESKVLTMWVRGRKDTKFTVSRKPEGLDVAIVAKEGSGTDKATKYEVTIKVPPGTASGRSIVDEIILKTDHPKAGEVKIPVEVLVHG